MNELKVKEIFSDEAFVKQLLEQEEPEQVQALLAEKEIELSIKEIETLRDMIIKHCNGELNLEELSEDDLEGVSGGVLGTILGVASLIVGIVGIGITSAQWVDTEMRNRRRRW